MSEVRETATEELAPGRAMIDPFSYFEDVRSKISGLGGVRSRPEIDYGFHTHYVRCAPGRCTMTVTFSGLTATYGSIDLRVHMLSIQPGAQAKIAQVERIMLADLATIGGVASVTFESLRGQIYALYGMIAGTTDAAATALTIELDRPGREEQELDPGLDIAPTALGRAAFGRDERLTSDAVATFATPVSQACTAAQQAEQSYRRMALAIGEASGRNREQWSQLYVLQALDRYGLLERGARGLCVGDADERMIRFLSERGCDVVPIKVAIDAASDIEAAIGHFDFLWADQGSRQAESAQEVMASAEAVMGMLRPGGLGIHVFGFIRDADAAVAWNSARAFNRAGIQRFALGLVSQGYDVAQLRFEMGPRAVGRSRVGLQLTSFGVIARRPLIPA